MISFFSSQGALTRSLMVEHAAAVVRRTEAQPVSAKAGTAGLADDERETAIKRAGELMEKRYADYARSGDFKDLGDAHHALLVMKRLIAGRSPEMVRRLEIKRGLI